MAQLRSYTVSVKGIPEFQRTINHVSPGKAKVEYWRELQDSWEYPYIMIVCKVNGLPYTSDQFKLMAKYRQIEFAYCGMQVSVGGEIGFIVGHNEYANLDVLFMEGKYAGQTLNCHVEQLNTVCYARSGILEKHIMAWVKENNIKLELTIGTVVKYKCRLHGLVDAEIMKHYEDRACYGIWHKEIGQKGQICTVVTPELLDMSV